VGADVVVGVSVAILVVLFCVQSFGTDKVGYTFAPAILLWFICIALIGVYNIAKYDPTVFKAFNPYYIYDFFKRNKHDGWVSLGGIVLAITGTPTWATTNIHSLEVPNLYPLST
jgi:KUP system potassium uptake protein